MTVSLTILAFNFYSISVDNFFYFHNNFIIECLRKLNDIKTYKMLLLRVFYPVEETKKLKLFFRRLRRYRDVTSQQHLVDNLLTNVFAARDDNKVKNRDGQKERHKCL